MSPAHHVGADYAGGVQLIDDPFVRDADGADKERGRAHGRRQR